MMNTASTAGLSLAEREDPTRMFGMSGSTGLGWRVEDFPPDARRSARGGAAILIGAICLLIFLLIGPPRSLEWEVAVQHFYVVTAVAAVAGAVAAVLAVNAVRIQHYKLLLLSIGFMTMGGFFAIHGLATPGVIVSSDAYGSGYSGSVVSVTAFLSLALPAVFFSAGYTRLFNAYERRLPFWPAGWLVAVVASMLLIFGVVALSRSELVAQFPVGTPPLSYILAGLGVVLLCFAAAHQLRNYFIARVPLQGSLALAFLLLAVALVAMGLAPTWTPAWWEYHVLMLAAVALALRALALERTRGRSMRNILEAALELQVRADVELHEVAEIAALAAAIEEKDRDTRGHTARVADLAVAIGREMGMPNSSLRMLARAGLLHDIGKLRVPDAILLKPGPLDDNEWAVMKMHPEIGVHILDQLGKFKDEAALVMHHHEREDGSGYPGKLAGDEIPLGARILAVADTYDVLVSDRPYRRARTREEARAIMLEERGGHLYPRAVDALLRIVHEQNASDRRRVPRLAMASPAV
jgi:putative nucleotidyltransferase with HDIG domain